MCACVCVLGWFPIIWCSPTTEIFVTSDELRSCSPPSKCVWSMYACVTRIYPNVPGIMLISLRRWSRPVPFQDRCQVGQIVMQTSQHDSKDIWIDPRILGVFVLQMHLSHLNSFEVAAPFIIEVCVYVGVCVCELVHKMYSQEDSCVPFTSVPAKSRDFTSGLDLGRSGRSHPFWPTQLHATRMWNTRNVIRFLVGEWSQKFCVPCSPGWSGRLSTNQGEQWSVVGKISWNTARICFPLVSSHTSQQVCTQSWNFGIFRRCRPQVLLHRIGIFRRCRPQVLLHRIRIEYVLGLVCEAAFWGRQEWPPGKAFFPPWSFSDWIITGQSATLNTQSSCGAEWWMVASCGSDWQQCRVPVLRRDKLSQMLSFHEWDFAFILFLVRTFGCQQQASRTFCQHMCMHSGVHTRHVIFETDRYKFCWMPKFLFTNLFIFWAKERKYFCLHKTKTGNLQNRKKRSSSDFVFVCWSAPDSFLLFWHFIRSYFTMSGGIFWSIGFFF